MHEPYFGSIPLKQKTEADGHSLQVEVNTPPTPYCTLGLAEKFLWNSVVV
jgi:hypothetical protein